MIIYLLVGAITMLTASILSVLPCGSYSDVCTAPFAPIPPEAVNAFNYIGETAGYFIYYFGESIGDAIVNGLQVTLVAGTLMLLWRALTNFRAPIIQRFTHGPEYRDV